MHLRRVVLLVIGANLVLCQSMVVGAKKTTPVTKATTTPTSTTPTTKATTPTTKATTPTTNATTPTTNATTPTTNATTPTTNATTPTTNATTPTASTTTPPSTTTPMASTTPEPEPPTFVVNGTKGSACIMEQLQAKFVIRYNKTDENNKITQASIDFSLPESGITVDAKASMCGSAATNATNATSPTIILVWGDPLLGNRFVQVFAVMGNSSSMLQSVVLFLNHTEALFPNSTQAGKLVEYNGTAPEGTFKVNTGSSFKCRSPVSFPLKFSNVTFSNMKVQVTGIVNNTFSKAYECPQDFSTTPASTTPSTTTPMPTQTPLAEWVVRDKNNNICILVNMALNFSISYNMTNGTTGYVNESLPQNASSANSMCSNTTAKLILTFFDGWILEMDFKVYNNKTYNNTMMTLTYMNNFTTNGTGENVTASTNETGIAAAVGKYFSCTSLQKIPAREGNVTFSMKDVQIQPFAGLSKRSFGDASECSNDQGFNNVIPIAVGCALAGLVIIVLVAYLIGRQRSSKSGYESV